MFSAETPFAQAPSILKWSRKLALPFAVAVAPSLAWFGGGRMDAAALNATHLACLFAALLAFWVRPRASRFLLSGLVCASLWLIWFGWILLGYWIGDAPAATFPYLVTALSAALLLYAACQSARLHPRLTLLFLALGQALMIALKAPGDISILVAAEAVFAGLVILPLTVGKGWSDWRWGFVGICMAVLFAAFWTVRCLVPGHHAQAGGLEAMDGMVRVDGLDTPSALARREFRSHLLTGISLGGFESRLRGYETVPSNIEASSLLSFFPEREAQILGGATPSDPPSALPVLSNRSGLRPDAGPGTIRSLPVYAAELGLVGSGIALACLLFLAATALHAVSVSRRSSLSLLTLGVLAAWLGLFVEGALGPALRKPFGLLMFGLLTGVLWGVTRALREAEEDNPSAPDFLTPAWWGAFAFSLVVAVGLTLVTALPLRGQALLAQVRRADPASMEPAKAIALLEHAGRLDPASADIPLLLAEEYRRLPPREGYQQAADAYYAARKRDPCRDDIYAAQARFHRDRNEGFHMREVIEEGRARCPNSALLAAWRIEDARGTQDPARLEIALREAIRVPALDSRLRLCFQEDLARLFEKQDRPSEALEAYCRCFQYRPGDSETRRAIERLSAAVFKKKPATPAQK